MVKSPEVFGDFPSNFCRLSSISMSNNTTNLTHNPNYMTGLTAGDQLFRTPDGHEITHQDDHIHHIVHNNDGDCRPYPSKYEVSRTWKTQKSY